jgi:hypothetical protein
VIYSLDVTAWRAFFATLDGLTLYAFLKELSHELHDRDLIGWRAVSEIADEVHDQCQQRARAAAENLLACSRSPGASIERPRSA